MHRFLLLFFAVLTQLSSAFAQSNSSFNKQAFLREGLAQLQGELLILSRDNLLQDSSCPKGGSQVFENLFSIKDNLFSAMNSVENLMSSVGSTAQAKRVENNRCGQCRQNNLVSSIASISPQKTITVPECQSRPTETFRLAVQSKREMTKFTEALLKGKNSEGKRLAAGCPDPCAYYVNTAQTVLPNGKTELAITVQCGQPRKDSVFSAVYDYQSGIIHQWTCSK